MKQISISSDFVYFLFFSIKLYYNIIKIKNKYSFIFIPKIFLYLIDNIFIIL